MRKALITSVAAFGLMVPAVALAQPRSLPTVAIEDHSFLSDVSPWVVVGAAAVVGIALFEVVPNTIAYLAVGGLGGYLATVWYDHSGHIRSE